MILRSILDYDINIYSLKPEDTSYTALNMNYSVAGFQLVLSRFVNLDTGPTLLFFLLSGRPPSTS